MLVIILWKILNSKSSIQMVNVFMYSCVFCYRFFLVHNLSKSTRDAFIWRVNNPLPLLHSPLSQLDGRLILCSYSSLPALCYVLNFNLRLASVRKEEFQNWKGAARSIFYSHLSNQPSSLKSSHLLLKIVVHPCRYLTFL